MPPQGYPVGILGIEYIRHHRREGGEISRELSGAAGNVAVHVEDLPSGFHRKIGVVRVGSQTSTASRPTFSLPAIRASVALAIVLMSVPRYSRMIDALVLSRSFAELSGRSRGKPCAGDTVGQL